MIHTFLIFTAAQLKYYYLYADYISTGKLWYVCCARFGTKSMCAMAHCLNIKVNLDSRFKDTNIFNSLAYSSEVFVA